MKLTDQILNAEKNVKPTDLTKEYQALPQKLKQPVTTYSDQMKGTEKQNMKGLSALFTITPNSSNLHNTTPFMSQCDPIIKLWLQKKLITMKSLKFNLIPVIKFFKEVYTFSGVETVYTEAFFRSKAGTIVNIHEGSNIASKYAPELNEKIEKWINEGSQWRFHSNVRLDVSVIKHKPLKHGSYIKLNS